MSTLGFEVGDKVRFVDIEWAREWAKQFVGESWLNQFNPASEFEVAGVRRDPDNEDYQQVSLRGIRLLTYFHSSKLKRA